MPDDESPILNTADRPVYLIVGASGGIGSHLSRRLSARGAHVILAGRNKGQLADLAGELSCSYFITDATDFEQMRECFSSAQAIFGRLDGAANCVGSLLLRPAHRTTEKDWHHTLQSNLTSAFLTVKFAAEHMTQSGGSVVLVSSCAARIGLANHEAIAAAKAGVEGLVRSAAATYAKDNIRFNCAAPGLVQTPLTRSLTANENQLRVSQDMHPLGKLGTPADISSIMDWLLSIESAWVTGQCFAVDGGMSTLRVLRSPRPAN